MYFSKEFNMFTFGERDDDTKYVDIVPDNHPVSVRTILIQFGICKENLRLKSEKIVASLQQVSKHLVRIDIRK